MKLQIASDLHIAHNSAPFMKISEQADGIILAGDVCNGLHNVEQFIKNNPTKLIVHIPGNHEYYDGVYQEVQFKMVRLHQQYNNYIWLNNKSHAIGDFRILGATLWTDFGALPPTIDEDLAISNIHNTFNDFRQIRYMPDDLTTVPQFLNPSQLVKWNSQSMNWLTSQLEGRDNSNTLVVTHFAPSAKSIHPRFMSEVVDNAYFVNVLDDFILEHQPSMWIHGHVHQTHHYTIGSTEVICNPVGYEGEVDTGFVNDLIIDTVEEFKNV